MPKILVIPGSNRAGSFNVKLAAVAAKELAILGADVTRISLSDYSMPLYDDDLKTQKGIPENVYKLGEMIKAHDGIFIASPEYNSSISPLVKNTIDWVSVLKEKNGTEFKPFNDMIVALGAASPGNFGGVRGLNHLRTILVSVGCQVISEQTVMPRAKNVFDDSGNIIEERTLKSLNRTCQALIRFSHIA